ncbi:MAG: hypothetical protein SH850_12740 [Planctomycetaceae bacterium]|nr:hypothetical protein [Planctomycetaceae bacterium]
MMLGLLLVGYVLLPMPLSYVMHRGGLNSYGPAFVPLIFATYPLRIAAENSTIVGGFYEAEWKWLEMTFGPALGEPFHLAYLDRPRASRVPTESA